MPIERLDEVVDLSAILSSYVRTNRARPGTTFAAFGEISTIPVRDEVAAIAVCL